MLLNNERDNSEIMEEIKKYLETNKNGHTITQNLWDTVKAVQRWKFIAMKAYLKKIEKSEINKLSLYLQELENNNKAQSEQKEGNNQDQSRIK